MKPIKIVLLAEGETERIVIPILFQRCVEHIKQQDNIEIKLATFIESRNLKGKLFLQGKSKVVKLLKPTYYQCASDDPLYPADVLLVGIDNDNKKDHPPHVPEHKNNPDKGCFFCLLEKEIIALQQSTWISRKLPTIIFVPVEVIESWLLFGANIIGGNSENFPEQLDRNSAKTKLCHTDRLTESIIQTHHKPIAEKIDIANLRRNVPSFDWFYIQIEKWTANFESQ